MERQQVLEEQFKKRYNRDVEVYRELDIKDKKITHATVKIIYKDNEFQIDEFLTDDQMTEKAIVTYTGKQYLYQSYLLAEVHVADCIGAIKE